MAGAAYLLFVESNTTGSGIQALQKARELGLAPVLLARKPSLYPEAEAAGCRVVECETNDPDALRSTVSGFLGDAPGELRGITTTSEFYLEAAAALAEGYRLPANPVSMIRACRDKGHTRQILADAGLPQPRFTIVRRADEVEEAVARSGLPCVVKPCADTGSYGVKLCNSVEGARAHAKRLLAQATNVRGQPSGGAVVCEEYVEAPEFSVETFAWEGRIACVGITEKRVMGLPYFVECGHVFPARLTADVAAAIAGTTRRALRLVGNAVGPIHTEVKWTPRGCVIVEINARLAGGMIPELVGQAIGVDLLKGQILAACGRPPSLTPVRSGHAGIHFLTAPAAGTLVGIARLDRVRELPGVVRVTVTAAPGAAVNPPRSAYDRLGYVIARAETYEALVGRLARVRAGISVVVGPGGEEDEG